MQEKRKYELSDHFSQSLLRHFMVYGTCSWSWLDKRTYLRPATLQKADMVFDVLERNEETGSQELKWKRLLRSAEETY